MMQPTEEPRGNIFQRVWKRIRGLFRNNTTTEVLPSPSSVSSLLQTQILQTATLSTKDKAAALLEPFHSLLLKQFSVDDIETLKIGLERKLELGISIDQIQHQLRQVRETYDSAPSIDDVLDSLSDICGVKALKIRTRTAMSNSAKSLQTSLRLFNKKFSKPCELTQTQCLSLPQNILSAVLNNFEGARQFLQDNGLTFEQLKFLSESSSGQIKLEMLLEDDSGLIRLLEHDIAFETLAELDLDDFKILLTDTDSNEYAEWLHALQPKVIF